MRLPDFSFSSDTLPAIMSRAAELNRYVELVKAENFIKVGVSGEGEPRYLPGILDSIEVGDSLLVDEADTQNKSGSVKIISGWADVDLTVNLLLIDIPVYTNERITPGITRFDCLNQIIKTFRQMRNGKPCVFTVLHPHVTAWGAREFIFNGLKSSESRGKRIITCSLEFDEFDSVAGKSQDRQLNATTTTAASNKTAATSVDPVVGDETRRGLGKLEGKYAKQ
jgi:hypothetical protein